jgi:hypothetical protein
MIRALMKLILLCCKLMITIIRSVSITNSIATGDFEDSMVLLKIVDSADIMSGMVRTVWLRQDRQKLCFG